MVGVGMGELLVILAICAFFVIPIVAIGVGLLVFFRKKRIDEGPIGRSREG